MKKNTANLGQSFGKAASSLGRYRALLFFLFLAFVYGFIVYRINVLSTAEPDQAAITQASAGPGQPHIDPSVVQKITDLQDNSVNVQALFDQARQNPFHE